MEQASSLSKRGGDRLGHEETKMSTIYTGVTMTGGASGAVSPFAVQAAAGGEADKPEDPLKEGTPGCWHTSMQRCKKYTRPQQGEFLGRFNPSRACFRSCPGAAPRTPPLLTSLPLSLSASLQQTPSSTFPLWFWPRQCMACSSAPWALPFSLATPLGAPSSCGRPPSSAPSSRTSSTCPG